MIHSVLLKYFLFILCLVISIGISGQSSNTPELLGKEINTEYNEIGPVIAPDGKTLFFSRISHPQNAHGANGSQDIWYSEYKNSRWTNAVRMPAVVNKDVYNSIYSITPDGNTILLKGSYNKGVYQTRGFSISRRIRRTWSVPETLIIPDYEKMSKGEFDCGFLANDGQTLLMSFSEKRKGRNDDLYVSFKDKDGKWSKPQSLGSDINTPGHMETTPFLAADGITLYFSSDRPGGQGGNDIYSSRRLDGTWKKWSKPVNLGPAVNTPGFEGYYSVSAAGDFAYWSSNNDGATQKGDVYRLSLKSAEPTTPKDSISLKQPAIIAVGRDQTLPDPVAMISGKVLDSKTGKPVEARIVFQAFPDGREIGTASTDPETGEYKFTLPYGSTYTMRPIVPGFIAETELIDLTDATVAGNKRKNLLVGSDTPATASQPSTGNASDSLIAERGESKGKDGQDRRAAEQTGEEKNRGNDKSAGDTSDTTATEKMIADAGKEKTDVSSTSGKKQNNNTENIANRNIGETGTTNEKQPVADVAKADPTPGKVTESLARNKKSNTGADETGGDKSGSKGSNDLSHDYKSVSGDTVYVREYQELDRNLKVIAAEVGGVVRLNNIFFETARSRLMSESKIELDQMVEVLKAYPAMEIELGGHTDSEGSEATNLKLSQDRSNAVKNYLVQLGIAADRVKSVGYGESRPVATNETAEGRQANRRVEFTILKK